MNSFGLPTPTAPLTLSDPALRATSVGLLAHAAGHLNRLIVESEEWWSANAPEISLRVRDDKLGFEVVLKASETPPVEKWQLQANDVVQNLRSALDAFTGKIAAAHKGREKADLPFAHVEVASAWSSWKGHSQLPQTAIDRVRDMQTFNTGRPTLPAIRRLSNLGKHAFTVRAEVGLNSLRTAGSVTIEGLPTEEEAKAAYSAAVPLVDGRSGTITLTGTEQVVSEVTVGYPIAELPPLDQAEVQFVPNLVFDETEIPMIPGLIKMTQEVDWVIAYVAGLHGSSKNPPRTSLIPRLP